MNDSQQHIDINENEIELTAVRSQGAGGQNVNKVATAIHLRFAISSSSLPDAIKEQLLKLKDKRITSDGVIIIKAQRFRTQEKNKEDAMRRLAELIKKVSAPRKKRKKTSPPLESKVKRREDKSKRSTIKSLRSKVNPE